MRVKPSFVCCWLTWKIFDSASSSSSAAVMLSLERLGDDRVETSISRRRIAFSRTICA